MLIEAKALQLHHDLLMAFDQQPFIWNVTQESANEDKVGISKTGMLIWISICLRID